MNFLAHLYLSGNSEEIMVGNFIGDYVKGRHYENYPPLIKHGILLHRKIDDFTDKSPLTRISRNHFTDTYHRYAGALTDVIYDHFLATQWDDYASIPLHEFRYLAYENLLRNFNLLPDRVKNFLPYLVISDWLDSYRTLKGLAKAFHVMAVRTSMPSSTGLAIREIENHYENLKNEFNNFFPELIRHIKPDLKEIKTFIKE